MPSPTPKSARSYTALLTVAWLVVVIPTAWGLEHTIENALKLFRAPAPAAAAPASAKP